jgi:competence protein ComEA
MDLPNNQIEGISAVGLIKNNQVPLILASGSIICIIISVILLVKTTQTNDEIEFGSGVVEGLSTIGQIKVDVAGEVVKPGVYSLSLDSRVEDAISSAGGLTVNADLDYVTKKINRAARVVDGGKIYIPIKSGSTMSHNQSYATSGEESEPVSRNLGGIDTISQASSQNGAGKNIGYDSSTETNNLISINDATVNELDTLPGIGPVTAQKIIDNRPYQVLEELLTKKAVGKSVYSKIISLISL